VGKLFFQERESISLKKIPGVRGYHLLILLLIILQSCTKAPQFIDTTKESDNLYIVESDTLQPAFVIYRLDSFLTSGSNRALIGRNTDPYFGLTTTRSFSRFNIAPDNYLNIGTQTESYDSVALIMHIDRTYTGDTSLPWSASVHTLTQDLDAINTHYYNHQQLTFSPAALGNISVKIRPGVDDSVVIKLDQSFGSDIFNLYRTKNESIVSQNAFQRYFKGLCIESDSSDNIIYGFKAADTGTVIRVYYHDDQGVHVNKHLDFKSEGGNFQFNNIETDPTGTITESVVPNHDVPSALLGHKLFVSDLAGIGTKFTFPGIKAVATLPDYVRLQSVQLKLIPVPTSFIGYPLIRYLGLGISNQSSTALTPLYSSDNTKLQNGGLLIDIENGMSTGYTYDLSAFSRSEIVSDAYTTNTLYLQPISASTARTFSLNRLVAADNTNPQSPSKVILQMLFFKK
jgi:hypothetical protein